VEAGAPYKQDVRALQRPPFRIALMQQGPQMSIQHRHANMTGALVCDTEGEGFLVVVGIMIGLGSSVILNLGQNLQALGQQPGRENKTTWGIGLTLFISGSLGNMVAMAFASASILVPLESSQFVTNIFFSKLVLKKEITLRQWSGTALAVAGTILTCVFGPNDARCFTIDEMISFWSNGLWITYLLVSISAAVLGWMVYYRMKAMPQRTALHDEVLLPALFALSSALLGGAQMIVHSKVTPPALEHRTPSVLPRRSNTARHPWSRRPLDLT
jgi:uncharacterized membrane protein